MAPRIDIASRFVLDSTDERVAANDAALADPNLLIEKTQLAIEETRRRLSSPLG